MIHQEIRARFEASIKAPLGRTKPIEAFVRALTQHGGDVTSQYEALSSPVTYTPFDPDFLDNSHPTESLGSASSEAPTSVSALYYETGKSEPHDHLASLLQHIGNLSEVWRAVLNYPQTPSGDLSLHAFIAQQAPNKASYLALTAWLGRAAFTDPEATKTVYDAIASGWQDGKELTNFLSVDWGSLLAKSPQEARKTLQIPVIKGRSLPCAPVPAKSLGDASLSDNFPDLLWALLNAPEKALDAYEITSTVAGFGEGLDASYTDAFERTLLSFEGLSEITATPLPKTVEIETLKDTPEGSLGQTFYRLITDNNFDVEVLDPTSLFGPADPNMTPAEWMNRRILQLHDIIHLVAGYQQIGEDEVAISGFQLAQIGQAYSAWFLSVSTLITSLYFPAAVAAILELSLTGWKHGRETKPLILVDWESQWSEQISTIRQMHNITPFASGATSINSVAAD